MSIIPSVFVDKMEQRWTGFGNVVNPPLRLSWVQQCTTFNDKVRASEAPWEEEAWKVLCPPTGSGKTQGVIVYASMLNTPPIPAIHPGMIIVTRRIADADGIAQQINELSRQYAHDPSLPDMAISYHSGKRGLVNMSELVQYPVLIITHKAYSLAFDQLAGDAGIQDMWDYYYTFKAGRRKLVVIDEAIELVEYSEVQLQNLKNVLHFSESIKENFPSEWDTLHRLKNLLIDIEKKEAKKEMILQDRPTSDWFFKATSYNLKSAATSLTSLNMLDLTGFSKAMGKVRMDKVLQKQDRTENMRLVSKCRETVSAVNALLKTFIYYSRNKSGHTFNTARYIVPPNARGGVILDATATCNVMYELFQGASVIQPPTGTRNYQNVSLHVSCGHKVGKYDMVSKARSISDDLVASLDEKFSKDPVKRKVLVVTHMDVEPSLLQCIPKNFTMSVAHWQALDGSNDWNDHDTVVIFGLPYKPQRWSAAVFMGYQGMQSTSWLQDSTLRKFNRHGDIRRAMELSKMTTDIIQAVNRVHCRRVIDMDGNCPVTDVFMMLSSASEVASLLDGIAKEMPGIHIKEWNYDHQKQGKRGRKPGRGNLDQSLISLLKSMKPGDRVSASEVKGQLLIKPDTWKDMMNRVKTAGSVICEALQKIGVIYQVDKQRASFFRV